jgi:imidazolonepropionase-like amidohydrolase
MKWSHSSLFRRVTGLLLAVPLQLGFFGASEAADIAFIGAKIYPAPGVAPIDNGVIVVSDGKITAIGLANQVTIPDGAEKILVDGKVITAGLWNSHVHFDLPPLDRLTDDQISVYVRDMLLRYGFVHVLDTGSLPGVTQELRRRVQAQVDMALQFGADAIKIFTGSIVGLSERGIDVFPHGPGGC